MNKKTLIVIISFGAALAVGLFIFFNSRRQSAQEILNAGSLTASQPGQKEGIGSPENFYESTANIPVTDPLASNIDAVLRTSLQEVFGGAKVSLFFAGSGVAGQTIEYTLPRATTARDLSPLVAALSRRGYMIQFIGQQENAASFMVRDSSTLISGSYEIGKQKVGIVVGMANN